MNVLGKISLILSLFCFLLSLGFRLALQGWIPFIGWGFGFGAFFLLFSLAINYKFMLGVLKSESLHFLSKSLGLIVIVVAILFVLNFIVHKQNVTADLTRNKIHSLSDLTKSLIKGLPEKLSFYYFHVGNASVRGYEAKVREFLNPYLRLNSKIRLESHSVFQNPDLAKKFKTGNEESSLFVEYQDRISRVTSLSEAAVTNAVLKVSKKPKIIYFLTGHDERHIDDKSTFGAKGIKTQLERLHYKIKSLDISDRFPSDIAMLVMLGPRKPISEEHRQKLQNFVLGGGALFLAVDPGEEHNINSLLENFGIQLQETFVFSAQAQAGQSELLVLTHAGKLEHEVAATLQAGENPVLFISSALDLNSDGTTDIALNPILEHLPNSVGRGDISPDSPVVQQGPMVAAAVAEGLGATPFRLAVVADSDFITNQFYAQPANFNFLLAIVTYLSKDEDLLKMRPPQAETTYLIMTQTQMNLYFLFFILPYCLIFFIFGLFFKLRRFF